MGCERILTVAILTAVELLMMPSRHCILLLTTVSSHRTPVQYLAPSCLWPNLSLSGNGSTIGSSRVFIAMMHETLLRQQPSHALCGSPGCSCGPFRSVDNFNGRQFTQ